MNSTRPLVIAGGLKPGGLATLCCKTTNQTSSDLQCVRCVTRQRV